MHFNISLLNLIVIHSRQKKMCCLLFNKEMFKSKQDGFPALQGILLNALTYIFLFDSHNSHC